jgi:hypothetical protein
MPTIITRGAASAQGFGEFSSAGVNPNAYIENLFSTWLYAGTNANQTITNNINLSGNGGLVWIKDRTSANNHNLFDTAQGATKFTHSNLTDATATDAVSLTSFNADGFSLGTGNTAGSQVNTLSDTLASWTFRKQAKFFDIVIYTGTGANRTISHNLGSTPGCIMVKRTDTTADWQVYHSGLTSAAYSIQLNLTNAQASAPTIWNSTTPTSAVFSVGTDATVNASGGTYVAYLFASNAGGFGSDGTQNVITCGAYTGTGAVNNIVNLGYEPQWLMVKPTDAYDWRMFDVMRGLSLTDSLYLQANTSNAENDPGTAIFFPTATGFNVNTTGFFNSSGISYIYIAIRRGPMKVPTNATKVFSPVAYTGTGVSRNITGVGFPLDMNITMDRATHSYNVLSDRLRGISCDGIATQPILFTNTLGAEGSIPNGLNGTRSSAMDGYTLYGAYSEMNYLFDDYISYNYRRAPGFFDEVCYTGTSPGSGSYPINHNLGVAPELIILRQRNGTSNWQAGTNFTSTNWRSMFLNFTNAGSQTTYATNDWFSAQPTSTTFTVGYGYYSTGTWVAYLFASCPGVSKVGSYSGTGATQTINCGFTGGARFVLIKRTDSTGDWYVWDTARGMVAGTDPYSLLNSNVAETNANNVYTTTGGFQIVSTAAGINASGGAYIFLAIA